MKLLLTGFLLFLSCNLFAQPCSCLDDYYFIKDHIEKNHGGFNKKIQSPDEPAYKAFTQQLEKDIRENGNGKYCVSYLKKYILYLQDHHSNITGGRGAVVREDSLPAVEAFRKSPAYTSTELITIDTAALLPELRKKGYREIESIYHTADSSYVIALVKNKTQRRDYAGIILYSKTKLWTTGQVKLELKQLNDSLFGSFVSFRNHSINYDQVNYKKGKLELNGWTRVNNQDNRNGNRIDNDWVKFTVLDSNTSLLSIRSFDAGLTQKLDSVYKTIIPEIKKYPKLIIDVRNNGGGSDRSYKMLMPLLYTDPFESDVVEYYVTPGNIAAYEKYDADLLKRSPGSQPPFKGPVALMKKAKPYSFTGFGNGRPNKIQYTVNKGYPLKIAVLYNRNCASSCESFLFEILNSSKTIRVGENSGGYTGYGNVMNISTPCGNTLSWTTTVYREQWKYEFVGIPPQYRIEDDETDWIEYTKKLLEQ